MSKEYILKENGIHKKFLSSTAKVQVFGGGFGNGKTSAMIIKALELSQEYPGLQVLVARSTYPKLNDTIRKTFIDFCPPDWIASFPRSKNSENTCTLTNGSQFHFRYIAQRTSTEDGGSTSNLLSATYDLILVDQIEDPEITKKDFDDLFGRLRGTTLYRGNRTDRPRTGPRWIMVSCNPTRNWFYKYVIAPYQKFINQGIITDDLLCFRNEDGTPRYNEDGTLMIMMELFEGSTYENKHVLPADFIEGLASKYKGQMKDRFLLGKWVAYEGLVYPDFTETMHMVPHQEMLFLYHTLKKQGYRLVYVEGYDFGIAKQSCYLWGFVDQHGNVHILDGFYEKEYRLDQQSLHISKIRNTYVGQSLMIRADPDIFKRKGATTSTIGKSISDLFFELNNDILFVRGNNDIKNGIVKVSSYLNPYKYHVNPYDGSNNAPYIYFSDKLQFIADEFNGYYWKSDKQGEHDDEPTDRNDHAMDTLKYMLSERPDIPELMRAYRPTPAYMTEWQERESAVDHLRHRH